MLHGKGEERKEKEEEEEEEQIEEKESHDRKPERAIGILFSGRRARGCAAGLGSLNLSWEGVDARWPR